MKRTRELRKKTRSRKAPRYLDDFIYTGYRTKHRTIAKSKAKPATNLFFQSAVKTHEPNQYYLNDKNDIKNFSEKRGVTYVHPKRHSTIEFQRMLKIAPVNILESPKNYQALGVYTTRSIYIKPNSTKVIGHYIGAHVADGEENPDSSFIFELPDGELIDGSRICDFTAIINGALSEKMGNIKVQTCQTPAGEYFIEYCLSGGEHGLYIQSGAQLLGFYGSTAKYDDYQGGKKFLTPRDLSLSSAELYSQYNNYDAYQREPRTLEAAFLLLFDINPRTNFAIPKDSIFADCFDVPYLAYSSARTKVFLKQNAQENITRLMVACWYGDLRVIENMLNNGANPNMPSSTFGYTAFHITLLSSLDTSLKINIIELLSRPRVGRIPNNTDGEPILDIIKHNLTCIEESICWHCEADLTAQDKYEQTIAHIAVKQGDIAMLRFLLEINVNFWDFQDKDNNDILESAIISRSLPVIRCLLENINYLKIINNEKYQQIIEYLLSRNDDKKIPLFQALECLYNDKDADLETITSVYGAVRETFYSDLSEAEKSKMTKDFNQATNKYINNPRGLFRVRREETPEENHASLENTIW